jgi:hypothetical protein
MVSPNPWYRQAVQDIAAKAQALGIGPPISDVQTLSFTSFVQQFPDGWDIYWSLSIDGAHEVHGEIKRKYDFLGGPGAGGVGVASLGYPVLDEKGALDQDGRVSDFEHGSIYWSRRIGPVLNHELIKEAYGPTGWETGPLGYPTRDTHVWRPEIVPTPHPMVWGLFEHGAIANDMMHGARVLDAESKASIDGDTLKTLVHKMVDKLVHSVDINVGLHPNIDVVSVSGWSYGFPDPLDPAITYRIFAFRDMGLILPDIDFHIAFALRFTWTPSMDFFDGPVRDLAAQIVDGSLIVETVEGLPVDFPVQLGAAMQAPTTIATIPVDFPGVNPPIRVVLDVASNPNAGLDFLLNPYGLPSTDGNGRFGPEVQVQIDAIVSQLLSS